MRWQGYEEQIHRVIAHIHEHLDEDLDLNRLAEVACLSPYHWHRIYHAVIGETAAATVKRLRLQRAAAELAHTAEPVTRIAARCGYPSVASFTRIFRSAYGSPPAQYRKHGGHMLYTAKTQQGGPHMFPVEVRTIAPARLVTLQHRGSYMLIAKEFESIFGWAATRGLLNAATRSIGIYYDDPDVTPEAELRSRAGLVLDPLPSVEAPFETTDLRGGDYAVLMHKGPYSDLHVAYRWLYGSWLPESGRKVANAPAFEEYLNDPRDVAPSELLTAICMPLE